MDRKLIERLVALEWEFFQATRNEGGRATCQDDRETFWVMRTGQAMGWSEEMAAAWLSDLEAARAAGRNPVTEKYARMMAFTAPEAYAKLAHFLPPVEPEVEKLARALTDQTVALADAAAQQYPYFCASGRPIHSSEDSAADTSLETYCYGELLTCRPETLRLFQRYYEEKARRGENLYVEIETHIVHLMGYSSLEEAERKRFASSCSCCRSDPMQSG